MAYNWIKMLMDTRDISIQELAEAACLSPDTVRKYYKSILSPGHITKINLMRILDITSEEELIDCCDLTERNNLLYLT